MQYLNFTFTLFCQFFTPSLFYLPSPLCPVVQFIVFARPCVGFLLNLSGGYKHPTVSRRLGLMCGPIYPCLSSVRSIVQLRVSKVQGKESKLVFRMQKELESKTVPSLTHLMTYSKSLDWLSMLQIPRL